MPVKASKPLKKRLPGKPNPPYIQNVSAGTIDAGPRRAVCLVFFYTGPQEAAW
jgi:hypothetical protein